jgi:SAM-dependent MidA family methyltransferase
MRFDRFMEAALFDPEGGYYSTHRARIGKTGDFFTSVSVGPVYGRFIAAQIAEVHASLGSREDFVIVEQGGNDGTLALDILNSLQSEFPDLYATITYALVEPFVHLTNLQRERLSVHAKKVIWAETLPALGTVEGMHFSNEYADALPVRLLVRKGDFWLERHVTGDADHLHYVDLPTELSPNLPQMPEGYIAEFRPAVEIWIQEVCKCLKRGVILVADYGFPQRDFFAPWRSEGTLSCYRSNCRDDDPLDSPGEKDITAHVNFSALSAAAQAHGWTSIGYADQCHFLTGILESMLERTGNPSPLSIRERSGFLTLMHPEMMGTQFKFLALANGIHPEPPLSGFRNSPAGVLKLSESGEES